MSTYTIDSGYYRALVRERGVWKERAESAERQLAETREALAALIDWAEGKRGTDFGDAEWIQARRAVSPADTTEAG